MFSSLQILSLMAAMAILCEAVALAIGMHLLDPDPPSPWISRKNDGLLAFDGITGGGILVTALVGGGDPVVGAVWTLMVMLAILGHVYRQWEAGRKNTAPLFCFNGALVVMNVLKLLLLMVTLLWGALAPIS